MSITFYQIHLANSQSIAWKAITIVLKQTFMKQTSPYKSLWRVSCLQGPLWYSNSSLQLWDFHRPWCLSFITFISWWKCSQCSLLTSPKLERNSLRWLLTKSVSMLMLQSKKTKPVKKCLHQILVIYSIFTPPKYFHNSHKCIPCSSFYVSHRVQEALAFH